MASSKNQPCRETFSEKTKKKMAAAVGGFSGSKDLGFNAETENQELPSNCKIGAELDLEEDDVKEEVELDLGPQLSLKEQLEKDKDDESLRRWKEQLLGTADISAVGESKEAEVKVVRLSIMCPDRTDVVLPVHLVPNPKATLFSLKEGTTFCLSFSFTVSDNIVSGLKYINTVWKTGIKVDSTKVMLGTFSPQQESYSYELEEETTPSGLFARGSYSARTKFVDDDGKCYLDFRYQFEILKKWPSP